MDACKSNGAVSERAVVGGSGITSTGDDTLSGVEAIDPVVAEGTRRESSIGGGWARLRADH